MIDIFVGLYDDLYSLCGADTCYLDTMYLRNRVKHEGMAFLTISLPSLDDALLKGLTTGRWPTNDVSAFKRSSSSALPAFLSGLLKLVFHKETGDLLDSPSIPAISALHQLFRFAKKIELTCTKRRVKKAYQKYLQTDSEVKPLKDISVQDRKILTSIFGVLFGRTAGSLNQSVLCGNLWPKHGPGAVAEKYSPNRKYSAPWYERLDEIFPPDHYLVPSLGANGMIDEYDFIPIGRELPARITHVAKTQKTPRLIAIEPTCIMYVQQALMAETYHLLSKDRVVGSILNLRNQKVNANRALSGSLTGNLATIDLSEASDRVSAGLVSHLFKPWPTLRRALFCARSSKVSSHLFGLKTEHRLRKFASMGSAMCFPVEAMVFTTIVIYAMHIVDSRRITKRSIESYAKLVTIYGDDIIIPTDYAPYVALALTHFGLSVNHEKSFFNGLFRESCGVDAYCGVEITPQYVRTLPPVTTRNASEVASWVSMSNRLWAVGLWKTADYVARTVEKKAKCRLPNVLSTSPVLGLVTLWRSNYDTKKYDNVLHRPLVRGFRISGSSQAKELGGHQALSKALLALERREPSRVSLPLDGQVPGCLAYGIPSDYEGIQDLFQSKPALRMVTAGSLGLDIEPRPHACYLKREWNVPF